MMLPDCLFTPPDGMEFDAWAREENVVQDETVTKKWARYMPGEQAVLSMTGNNTFKALWKDAEIVYTVTFYMDSSKTDIYATKKVAKGRSISSLESPSRTGYAFSGWKMENGNAFTFDYIPNENINVYAEWTRTNPTVSFDANGGSGKMDTVAVDGSAGNYVYTVPECDFVAPSGKVFSHWQVIDDETKVYHPGSAVKNKIKISDVESNISLKAVWISACTATIEAENIGSENVIVTWTYSNQFLNDTLSGTGLSYPVGANLCVAVNVPTETYTVSGSNGVTFLSGENGWTTNNVSRDIVITVSIKEGAVIYLDADGSCKVCASATAVKGTEQEWGTEGKDTWYVVKSGITMNNRVEVRGNIHLILCDGATLSSEKGIAVNAGNSLTIYAQSMGNSKGKISIVSDQTSFTSSSKFYAAIGANPKNDAGDITINGGDIQVSTKSKPNSTNYTVAVIGGCSEYGFGIITINSGKVVAESDSGGTAVIGEGYQSKSGTIVINGGYVEARGTGKGSTGIGVGKMSKTSIDQDKSDIRILINGGIVHAYGGTGIGGYDAGNVDIIINDGDILATQNNASAGAATGEGAYKADTSVTLTAECKEDGKFIGWFSQEGDLLSDELVYVFDAKADITVVAKFEKADSEQQQNDPDDEQGNPDGKQEESGDQQDDPDSKQEESGDKQDNPEGKQEESGDQQDDPDSKQEESGDKQDNPDSKQEESGDRQDNTDINKGDDGNKQTIPTDKQEPATDPNNNGTVDDKNKDNNQSNNSTNNTTGQSTDKGSAIADNSNAKTNSDNEVKVVTPGKVKIASVKNNKSKAIKIVWKKVKDCKGYEVQYAVNKKFTKSKKNKLTTKLTLSAKKLKVGKTYYVRVRAYNTDTNDNKYYGKWSKVKKVKIKR
ncbi:MAG: hypothetical protein E7271_10775 [Lachnospiraceae bacterium]|nr:hypothetical protein [Lachnospiraceae bacterium]